jgi:poly(3-hydroxybutyrate) depolymerase
MSSSFSHDRMHFRFPDLLALALLVPRVGASCVATGLIGTTAQLRAGFSVHDLHALVQRLDTIEASAPHPLFARHARSLRALARSEWARHGLVDADDRLARSVPDDLEAIAAGLTLGNDRWEAFRDAGQPLVIAYLSKRDGTLQFYHLVLPRDWEEDCSYPLYLELHGSGGDDMRPLGWARSTLGTEPDFEKRRCRVHTHAMVARDGFHVLPYGRGNSNYEDIGEIDIWEALADAEQTLRIDPLRRYLYGFSMGGSGTYCLAAVRPDFWAAIAILGGSPGLRDAPEELSHKLAALPVFLWSGEQDPWFEGARRKAEALRMTSTQPREIVFAANVAHEYTASAQEQAHVFLARHVRFGESQPTAGKSP